ncbi:hypothetical protein DL96DRAFT_1676564 [Flagelloscypha sp. PMI_526]|nr:hypothetical protein DL96DRAFT_1676564 [Flagelloscypha sp. PMI_526]
MSSALSPDLFPTIFPYLSSKDLEACSLVNQFFRGWAQAILFSKLCLMNTSYPRTLESQLDFYLDDPRGRALCLHAKALIIEVAFIDDAAPRIVSFLQICRVLKHLELRQSLLYIENERFQGSFPILHHLTLENSDFYSHHEVSLLDAWLVHTKEHLRSLSLHFRSYPGDHLGHFLQGFTSLEHLFLGIGWYYFISVQSEFSHISLPNLPTLRKLTFQIERPRRQNWGHFFSWVGKLIEEKSLILPEVYFKSVHPAFTRPGKSSIRESHHDSFDAFNALADTSSVHLKIILQSSAPNHKEAFQQSGFEHIAALVKQWLSSWDNVGKLEIYRR